MMPTIAPRTTSVIAVIQYGTAYWAHVGDSRLYLVRDGEVKAQTRDHSQVRFVRQSAEEMPRACASLTRCLGGLPQPPTTTCGVPVPLPEPTDPGAPFQSIGEDGATLPEDSGDGQTWYEETREL